MLRFLQKRKFRLVTRWKAALKKNIGFQVPAPARFPYMLIFRAFDDVIRLGKTEAFDLASGHEATFLSAIQDPAQTPSADQYMELFLTGRDILDEFAETDPAFCSRFSERDRNQLRSVLQSVFKYLVDREMAAYSRRFSESFRS